MTKNQLWAKEYLEDRYMMHLHNDKITERLTYLMENLLFLGIDGRIGIGSIQQKPWSSLIQKFTHTQMELNIRKHELPHEFLKDTAIPKPQLQKSDRFAYLTRLASEKKPSLVKFGRAEYLNDWSLKISSASSFNDPSLNTAQADDEMNAIFHLDPKRVKIKDAKGNCISPRSTVDVSISVQQDFFIFCSSYAFDVRMFDNFDADACLFIYDSERFRFDLTSFIKTKFAIEDFGCKCVDYIDPIRPNINANDLQIEFHKHFKYQYQKEYRHVYIPKKGKNIEKHYYVNLNKASEYSELIYL